jgi:glutathione S-transferase
MSPAPLRLLGRKDAFNVRKVLWLLEELGEPFTQEDWGRGHRSMQVPEFLALNPLGTVPVLVDGDAVLRESHVIMRYLAATRGRTDLLPADPVARAGVEAWMDWVAYEMTLPMRLGYLGGVLGLAPWNGPGMGALGRAEYAVRMGVLEGALARGGPYLAGADLTLADMACGMAVHRWAVVKDGTEAATPALDTWLERLAARPGFLKHIRNGLP